MTSPDRDRKAESARVERAAAAADFELTVQTAGALGGQDLNISATIDARRLQGFVAYLQKIGFRPHPRPLRFDRTADGLPICARHNVPMRKRERQGDEWHSHKVIAPDGSELYCRGYDGPDSPGFRVEPGK
jgi:hypothetical protein